VELVWELLGEAANEKQSLLLGLVEHQLEVPWGETADQLGCRRCFSLSIKMRHDHIDDPLACHDDLLDVDLDGHEVDAFAAELLTPHLLLPNGYFQHFKQKSHLHHCHADASLIHVFESEFVYLLRNAAIENKVESYVQVNLLFL